MSKLPSLAIIRLKRCSVFRQLQIEEALLRSTKANWCLVNQDPPPAIVFGISGKPSEHLAKGKMEKAPLPLIRRYSGGGTVVVDEHTLLVSFLLEKTAIPCPAYPESILRWTESLYQKVFSPHPFRVCERDYVIKEKKCGGNAQYMQKSRFAHHTTFLWDYSQEKMGYLTLPKKTPSYRKQRPHDAFLCCIHPCFPSKEEFFQSLFRTLAAHYSLEPAPPLASILETPHRRSTTYL